MLRSPGHPVSPELLALWCTEVLGCFLSAYLLLAAGAPCRGQCAVLCLRAANQALVMALTVGFVSFTVGLYSADLYARAGRLLAGTAIGGCVAFPALLLAGRAVGIDFGAVAAAPSGWAMVGLVLAGWALVVVAIKLACSRARLFIRHVLVVSACPDDPGARRLVAALRTAQPANFDVMSVVSVDEATRLVPSLLRERKVWQRKVWGVVMTEAARRHLTSGNPASGHLAPGLTANRWRCRIHDAAAFWETCLRRVDVDHYPVASGMAIPAASGRADAALTRSGDVLLSLALMLVALPLMLLTAALIRLDSPGPVLYRQQRVGLHGRPFAVLKFRSMQVDAEARGPVWAAANDPRATRVGAFIRLTRIDELPQLANVLRGEMSFIGPRPERPHFVEQLAAVMPLYRERARVKPGLTGWAQVNYPYGASVEDARVKLSYDLYYVRHRSAGLAVLILFATIWVVLFRKGAR